MVLASLALVLLLNKMSIAKTPETPYYAVIFTAIPNKVRVGYNEMAKEMIKLSHKQDGFLGYESGKEELEITVSYWKDLDSIKNWKNNLAHKNAQEKGKDFWYSSYKVRIAKVEKDYEFIS